MARHVQAAPSLRRAKGRAVDQRRFTADWISRQLGLAERRRIMVLTCGIVAGRRSESGAHQELLARYQQRARRAIEERGGQVVWQAGPGLLAAWGLPRASEDHARLAVRSALRIAKLCRPDLPIGCAMETGLIIAGANAIAASGLQLAEGVYRSAKHLLDSASPGCVVVSDAFRRLLDPFFDLEPLDGKSPLRCWRIVGPRRRGQHGAGPDPGLVGRNAERRTLDEVWLRMVDGQPQCVSISGEAGIGKSRLLRHLKQRVEAARGRWIELDCFPETRRAPLHAIRQALRRLLTEPETGLAEFISSRDDRDRGLLKRLVANSEDVIAAPFETEGCLEARIFALVLEWLSVLAASGPVVLAFEDVHWADQGTVEFIRRTGERLGCLGPVCLAWTSRAPVLGGFRTGVEHARIGLARLSSEEIQQLLACSESGSSIPRETREQIALRSEGIPLFAAELARLCATEPSADRSDLLLEPGPLNTILSARLDALGAFKALAQSAAVVGRAFDAEVLSRVLQIDHYRLIDDLHELVGLGIIERLPDRAGRTTFRFTHALLRDAAYASVIESRRRALHRRTADLLAQDCHVAEQAPEIVARHFTTAGDCKGAFAWWSKAGMRAAKMSATRSAVHHLSQALAARRRDPHAGSLEEEVAVLRLLGVQFASLNGDGAPEAVDTFRHCLDLSREVAAPHDDFDARWALHASHLVRGEIGKALEVGEQLTASADRNGREERRLRAHRMQGLAKLLSGQLEESFAHYRLVLAIYDEVRHARLRFEHASDQGALSHAHLAWGEAIAGRPESSSRNAEAALKLSSRLHHPHTSAHVLCVLAARAQTLGEREAASALAFAGRTIAKRHEFPYWRAWADIILGWSHARGHTGSSDPAGVELIENAIRAYRRTGAAQALPYAQLLVADAALACGHPERALAAAAEGWQLAEQYGLMLYGAELLRVRAVAGLRLGTDVAHALRLAAEARELAIRQGAATFSARAAGFRIHPAPHRSCPGRDARTI